MLHVRRSELPLTLSLGGYFFLVVATHYLIKPVRNAVFLENLGADRLPWVYIGTAVVTWGVMVLYVRLAPRWRLGPLITGTLVFLLANLLAFWWWLPGGQWLPAVFYIWVKVYGVLLPSQFWLLAEEILDNRQAKRLFGPVGAGGILGSIAGSALAGWLAEPLTTENLLLLAGGGLVAATGVVLVVRRFAGSTDHPAEPASGGREPGLLETITGKRPPWGRSTRRRDDRRSHQLLRSIAALLTLTIIVHTIVDWQFNKMVEIYYVDLDERTAFFGQFSTVINTATLLLQLAATSWVLRYFGLRVALLLLPVALAFGAVGILLHPGLWTTALARGADDALRYSLDQSGRELLFLPVPSRLRIRFKPLIDLMASRIANGVAGVLILVAVAVLRDPLPRLSLVSLALIAAWILVAHRARGRYSRTLQRILEVRDIDVGQLTQARLDADARQAIREGLAAKGPATVHAALGLAEHTDPGAFVEELHELLQSTDDPGLKRHALHLLAEAGDREAVPDALATTGHPDRRLAAESLAYACAADDPRGMEEIDRHLEGDDPLLATAAAVCLLQQGDPELHQLGVEILERAVESERAGDGNEIRVAVASILRDRERLDGLSPLLLELLGDDDVEVARTALAAAGAHEPDDRVPSVCRAGLRRTLRTPALRTLVSYGDAAVGPLTGILADPRQPRQARQLAARALGRIGGRSAADGLLAGVPAEDPAARRAALKALNYMRRRGQDFPLTPEAEAAAIDGEWREFLSLHRIAGALEPPGTDDARAFVATVVAERIEQAKERFFRALALRYPIQTVFFAYRGLATEDTAARAHALELLDSTVERPLRLPLVRILEETDPRARARLAATELESRVPTPEAGLRELIAPGDPWLAACALVALDADPATLPEGLRQDLRATHYPPLLELLEKS